MSINKTLFESEQSPDCDVYLQFANCVNSIVRRSGYSRSGIADRMNSALKSMEVLVDESKINKWFAPSQPQQMPVQYLSALCWAIKSMEPVNILIAPLQYKVVDERAQKLQKHAELEVQKKNLEQEQAQILSALDIPNT